MRCSGISPWRGFLRLLMLFRVSHQTSTAAISRKSSPLMKNSGEGIGASGRRTAAAIAALVVKKNRLCPIGLHSIGVARQKISGECEQSAADLNRSTCGKWNGLELR